MDRIEQRRRAGRNGGLRNAALHDPQAMIAPAREAWLRRFFDSTPADLPDEERERRAAILLRLEMIRLSRLAAKARARKAREAER